MPTIQFFDINPEQMIAETKLVLEGSLGYTLSPADVEMIMILIMNYREQAIVAKMETAMHQNFVQLANGFALDYWGELFGVLRNANEEDDDYRGRILAQNRFQPIGTRAFYISKIKSLSFVSDVVLFSKQDDNSLPPGMIVICVIEKDIVGNQIKGVPMNITGINSMDILTLLSDQHINLIGDMFWFQSAVALPVNGTITVKKKIGVNTANLLTDVDAIVDLYFWRLSQGFSNEFANNDLVRKILEHPDVLSVASNSFPNLPIKQPKEFWVRGAVQITII